MGVSMGAGSSTLLLDGGGTLAAQELPSKMKSLVIKPSTLTMTRAGKVWFCGKVQERIPVLEDGTLQVLGTPLMVTSKSMPLGSMALGSMVKLM